MRAARTACTVAGTWMPATGFDETANANADLHVVVTPHVLGELSNGDLHGQGGVAGAQAVILVGEGRAEQGHDAVAHDLVHGAVVAVHGVDHARQHGIEQPACLLRIAIGQQLHRSFEIGEEHRHLLALALQCALGAEDLLGDVLGRVLRRGSEARLGGRRHRMGALGAELRVG